MKTTNTCTPDLKVKDQCSYNVWMEQQEDWREVEWKEKQFYNVCMLSQILCSDASPAKSTVRNLPQILHIRAIWMSRSYSDCSIVSFRIHRPARTTRPSGSNLVWCVYVPNLLRCCCAATMWDSLLHSPQCELEFCLIEGFVRGSASNGIWVLPILHLDLIWTPRTALFTGVHTAAVCSQRSQRLLPCSWHQTSSPLYLSTHLLGLCESLALRGRTSLFLETCHRPRYDGSGTESIVGTPIEYLRPFTNEVRQGIHARSHRQAAGCIRQWVCHVDETARSRKSTGYSRPALPRAPQRPPL